LIGFPHRLSISSINDFDLIKSLIDDDPTETHESRTRLDQDAVDIVVENEAGAPAGIAVKAAATVNAGDFKGLRKLADA